MKIIVAAVCLTAGFALPVAAAELCPNGQIAIIRVSTRCCRNRMIDSVNAST